MRPILKNIDVLNKFNLIENKIDVLNTTLNLKKYISKDFFNYIELKHYIKYTFYELKNEIINIVDTEDSINKINVTFNDYIEYIFKILDEKMKTFYSEKDLDVNIYTYECVKNIQDKIDSQLGERIRKLEDTLIKLQVDIKKTLDDIDEIVKREII